MFSPQGSFDRRRETGSLRELNELVNSRCCVVCARARFIGQDCLAAARLLLQLGRLVGGVSEENDPCVVSDSHASHHCRTLVDAYPKTQLAKAGGKCWAYHPGECGLEKQSKVDRIVYGANRIVPWAAMKYRHHSVASAVDHLSTVVLRETACDLDEGVQENEAPAFRLCRD